MSTSRFLHALTLTLILPFFFLQPAPGVRGNPKAGETIGLTGDEPSLSDKAILAIPAHPLISSSSRRLTLIDQTYLDAYTILQDQNSCSQFYGGPRIATIVLNDLYPRLKRATLDQNRIGIVMSGPVTIRTDVEIGISFRLFDKALINLTGPFFQNFDPRTHKFFQNIGFYPANTREARVVMLLHELGHLIHSTGEGWLLADDGYNLSQVKANTAIVMERCGEQVKSLSLPRPATEIAATAQTVPHR